MGQICGQSISEHAAGGAGADDNEVEFVHTLPGKPDDVFVSWAQVKAT